MITKSTSVADQIQKMERLAQGSAAWLFGISPRTLRDRQTAPRNSDGTYDAAALVAWHLKQSLPVDGDPLLAGSDSPALERFRHARADREELELAVRREQLLDIEEFYTWYESAVAGPLRKSLDKLQRKYGQAAMTLVAGGLQASQKAIDDRRDA